MNKIARDFAGNKGFAHRVVLQQKTDTLHVIIAASDSILRGLRMRLLSYDMPDDWNYFLFGDSHIGANLRHDKGFAQMVDMINSSYGGLSHKKNYAIDHGDMIEAITIDDKRYSVFDTREACVTSQKAMAKKELWPIRKKLLCGLDGNHPWKLHKFGPITHEICDALGVKFGTYSAKLTFRHKGKLQFKHYATHGNGSISSIADDIERRKLNWRLALKRKLRDMAGDCLLGSMGHTHKIIISPPSEVLYLTDNGKSIKQHHKVPTNTEYIHPDYRWYVNTGSFLKVYGNTLVEDDDVPMERSKLGSGYAERAMYPPLQLGFCVGLIRNSRLVDVIPEYV